MARASTLQRKGTAAFTTLHVRVIRLSRGRVWATMNGNPVLLLTTTGRRTGVRRTRPVVGIQDGARYVVCGTYAGSDTTPAWALNLASDPQATVEVGGRTLQVTSTPAEGAEYDRLWEAVVARMPRYRDYRTRTSRRFPLLVLTPVGEPSGAGAPEHDPAAGGPG